MTSSVDSSVMTLWLIALLHCRVRFYRLAWMYGGRCGDLPAVWLAAPVTSSVKIGAIRGGPSLLLSFFARKLATTGNGNGGVAGQIFLADGMPLPDVGEGRGVTGDGREQGREG